MILLYNQSGFISLPACVECFLMTENSRKQQTASHLKYFIDKHTLAIKDNELSALLLYMMKLLSGVQIETTHRGERCSAQTVGRQHL